MFSGLEYWLYLVIAPMLGGMLAASGFIVSKSPQAGELIKKLSPFQAIIGVALMIVFVLLLIDDFLTVAGFIMEFKALIGITWYVTFFSLPVVGFLLGMGLIAEWIPGEGKAETKALELQRKLIKWQVPIGLVALTCGVLNLLFRFIY